MIFGKGIKIMPYKKQRVGDCEPRLRGVNREIYCSPACGFNCTTKSYDKCHRDADALVEKLEGEWTKRVWENCAWHWKLSKGKMEVKPNNDDTYEAWFQCEKQFITNGDFENAQDAIDKALEMAEEFIKNIQSNIDEFKGK